MEPGGGGLGELEEVFGGDRQWGFGEVQGVGEVADKEFGGGIMGPPMGKSGIAVTFCESFTVGTDDERDVDPV